MDRIRDAQRGGLLGQTLILIGLFHDQASCLFSSMPVDEKHGRSIDVQVARSWTRRDQTKHALNCPPVIARGMIIVRMGVDRLVRCCLQGFGRTSLAE